MASGVATTGVFDAAHWSVARAVAGDEANDVTARFERLLSPEGVLYLEQLETGALSNMNWHPAAGGFEVPGDLVPLLERLWAPHVAPRDAALPDELTPGARYLEGAVQQPS
jgi:hypothetical protein